MMKQKYSIVIQTYDEVMLDGESANIHYFESVDNIRYEGNVVILSWLNVDNSFPLRLVSFNLDNVATLDAELEDGTIDVTPTDVQ